MSRKSIRTSSNTTESGPMFCVEDSPVRTYPTTETAQASKARSRACGRNSHGSFAKFDHDTSSWKTSPPCDAADLIEYSETWPRAGTMLNGTVSALPMSVPRIAVTESSSSHGREMFPTPTARDWRSGKASAATMARNSRPLSEYLGGRVNPPFAEWLMGFPLDWTSVSPTASEE